MPHRIFNHRYQIRSYEGGREGQADFLSLFNHFQDIAARHAKELGFGFKDLYAKKRAWVLIRAAMEIERMPETFEEIEVVTWPSGVERILATRNYEVFAGGELIGKAISAWATIDFEKRSMLDSREMFSENHLADREQSFVFPGRSVPRVKEGEHFATVHARREDHDINGHVNSKHLAAWAMESIPEDHLQNHDCFKVDMTFRSECHAGDELRSATASKGEEDGQPILLHSLTRPADNAEAVRMKTWWTPRKP